MSTILERRRAVLATKGLTEKDVLAGGVSRGVLIALREVENPFSDVLKSLGAVKRSVAARPAARQVTRRVMLREADDPKPGMAHLERGKWTGSDAEWDLVQQLWGAVLKIFEKPKDLADVAQKLCNLTKGIALPAINLSAMNDRMRDAIGQGSLPESRRTALPDNATIRRRLGYFKTAEGGEGGERLPDRATIRRLLG